MKEAVYIRDASTRVGDTITVQGWLYNFRSSGKVNFLELRDGTGYIQGVYVPDTDEQRELVSSLTQETSLRVTGDVSAHPRKQNVYELQVKDIEVLQIAEPYPISKKEHGPDFLLSNRHLWIRSKRQWATLKIRDQIIRSCMSFFADENFVKIDSPIITPVACEGTTTLFDIDYFDLGKGYLSQSGQLYLEAAIYSHSKVYDFGPVFRAEKSSTRKHLIEFWMMDAEMAFFEHDDSVALQEKFIRRLVRDVLSNCAGELELLERDIEKLQKIDAPFERMTHREMVSFLQKKGSQIKEDEDLGAGDETIIGDHFDVPVFIERWPAHIKAFYMKKVEGDDSLVLSADLMAPEGYGEIIGGSQREDDYDRLRARMEEEKLPIEDFEWYLDLRKYGSVPHSGFGLGLERLVGWFAGSPHVRETIPFPRLLNRNRP